MAAPPPDARDSVVVYHDTMPRRNPEFYSMGIFGKPDELARREEDLARREALLRREAEAVGGNGKCVETEAAGATGVRWRSGVPAEFRSTMGLLRQLLLLFSVQLLANASALLVVFFDQPAQIPMAARVSGVLIAAAATLVGPLAAVLLWFRPAFHAFRTQNRAYYRVLFSFLALHIAWQLWSAVGVVGAGTAGAFLLIACMESSDPSSSADALVGVVMALWVLCALFSVGVFSRIVRLYRRQAVEDSGDRGVWATVCSAASRRLDMSQA